MEYKEIYEEYVKENPEEMVKINALKKNSERIDAGLKARRKEKLKKIEECRRWLYG